MSDLCNMYVLCCLWILLPLISSPGCLTSRWRSTWCTKGSSLRPMFSLCSLFIDLCDVLCCLWIILLPISSSRLSDKQVKEYKGTLIFFGFHRDQRFLSVVGSLIFVMYFVVFESIFFWFLLQVVRQAGEGVQGVQRDIGLLRSRRETLLVTSEGNNPHSRQHMARQPGQLHQEQWWDPSQGWGQGEPHLTFDL